MIYDELKTRLMAGDILKVKELVEGYLGRGNDPKDILDNGLIAGMDIIGGRFKRNEVFIPEVMIAAKAMHSGLDLVKPHLAESGVKPFGKIVVGTVKGDLHDIGKNIVSMMFRGAGFDVVDCGIDVPSGKFIDLVKQENADILAMSSLLTTSMPFMGEVINLLTKENLIDSVRVMVGGAPVTKEFAQNIGAHGYAEDASSAVDRARELLRISAKR